MEAMQSAIPTWTPADRFRKARELTGRNQEEFADHSGISRATVSNYESPGYDRRHSRIHVKV